MSEKSAAGRGRELLRACEEGLCELAAEAALGEDLAGARQIAGWLALLEQTRGGGGRRQEAAGSRQERGGGERSEIRDQRSGGRGREESGYPRFVRGGRGLVKIGWSKRDQREYRHRVPWRLIEALGERLVEAGRREQRVSAGELFPLEGPGGIRFPLYQGYAALGWFRAAGLVEQPARKWYWVPDPNGLRMRLEIAWEELPEGE